MYVFVVFCGIGAIFAPPGCSVIGRRGLSSPPTCGGNSPGDEVFISGGGTVAGSFSGGCAADEASGPGWLFSVDRCGTVGAGTGRCGATCLRSAGRSTCEWVGSPGGRESPPITDVTERVEGVAPPSGVVLSLQAVTAPVRQAMANIATVFWPAARSIARHVLMHALGGTYEGRMTTKVIGLPWSPTLQR